MRAARYLAVKSARLIKREGLSALIRRLAMKMHRALLQTTCSDWYLRPLCRPAVSLANPDLDVSVDFLVRDKHNLANWLRDHHSRFPWMYLREEIETAKTYGHIFVTLSYSGKIIGYVKVGIDKVYVHDFKKLISLPPKSALIYDTFILPPFRNKHLASYAILRTICYLRESNFENLWCHIEAWNRASLRTFYNAGFRRQATVRFSRLFGFSFFIKNGYSPLKSVEDIMVRMDGRHPVPEARPASD